MTQASYPLPREPHRPLLLSLEDYESLYVENPRFVGKRFELIRGEVLERREHVLSATATMGDTHFGFINTLARELNFKLFSLAMVGNQTPVRAPLAASRPEPDFTLQKLEGWTPKVPLAGDTLALIELSDTTLEFDRTVKLGDYAREGVPEYWIVNLRDLTPEVYTGPQGDTYAQKQTYIEGQAASFRAFPNVQIEWWTYPKS